MTSAKGEVDVTSAATLSNVVAAVGISGNRAQLFEPSSTPLAFDDTVKLENLGFIAERHFVYDGLTGKFSHVLLHHQSGLGDGVRVSREDVLGKNYDKSTLPQPRLIDQSTPDNGFSTVLTAEAKAKVQAITAEKKVKAAKRKRENAKSGTDAALVVLAPLHASSMQRRCSGNKRKRGKYVCRLDPLGDSSCSAVYSNLASYEKHLIKGDHNSGPFSCASNRSRVKVSKTGILLADRMKHAIAATYKTKKGNGGGNTTNTPLGALEVTSVDLINGTSHVPNSRKVGWACSSRLPSNYLSKSQLVFILECFKVGVRDSARKVSPAEGVRLMTELGTLAGESKYPGNAYFKATVSQTPSFGRLDILDESTLKQHFGRKLKQLEAAVTNFEAREQKQLEHAINAFSEIITRSQSRPALVRQLQLYHVTAVLDFFQCGFGKVTTINRITALGLMFEQLEERKLNTTAALETEIARLRRCLPTTASTPSSATIPPIASEPHVPTMGAVTMDLAPVATVQSPAHNTAATVRTYPNTPVQDDPQPAVHRLLSTPISIGTVQNPASSTYASFGSYPITPVQRNLHSAVYTAPSPPISNAAVLNPAYNTPVGRYPNTPVQRNLQSAVYTLPADPRYTGHFRYPDIWNTSAISTGGGFPVPLTYQTMAPPGFFTPHTTRGLSISASNPTAITPQSRTTIPYHNASPLTPRGE